MKCIEYEIRVRTLGSGLYNAVPALKTCSRKGTTLTEFLVQCCSGPSTSQHLAMRRAEERTQAYLANQFASSTPLPMAAVRWSPRSSRKGAVAPPPVPPMFLKAALASTPN